MPLDIRAIENDTARVEVEYAGERVSVEFIPSRMTFRWQEELNELNDSPDSHRQAELVSEVVTGWDIVNNGEPVSTTTEGIMEVPLPVFFAVVKGIMEHSASLGRMSKVPKRKGILDQIFDRAERHAEEYAEKQKRDEK